jgi:hypothetical protein
VSTRFLIPNEQSDQLSEFCGIDPLRLGLNGRRLLFVEHSHACFRALSCPAIETGTSGGLNVPNDRQDVGRKLRRLRPAGRAHALHGASGGVPRALAASCQDVDAELLANGELHAGPHEGRHEAGLVREVIRLRNDQLRASSFLALDACMTRRDNS